jgi:hypothetical protein
VTFVWRVLTTRHTQAPLSHVYILTNWADRIKSYPSRSFSWIPFCYGRVQEADSSAPPPSVLSMLVPTQRFDLAFSCLHISSNIHVALPLLSLISPVHSSSFFFFAFEGCLCLFIGNPHSFLVIITSTLFCLVLFCVVKAFILLGLSFFQLAFLSFSCCILKYTYIRTHTHFASKMPDHVLNLCWVQKA